MTYQLALILYNTTFQIYLDLQCKTRVLTRNENLKNDISQTLKELANDLKAMRQTVDSQYTEICQLNRTVQAQSKEIKTLKKENSGLRTRLSKYEELAKDSTNSSTPPSKENMKSEVLRRTKSLREKSDKPIGGQPGHEGHTREMIDAPDEAMCQR